MPPDTQGVSTGGPAFYNPNNVAQPASQPKFYHQTEHQYYPSEQVAANPAQNQQPKKAYDTYEVTK